MKKVISSILQGKWWCVLILLLATTWQSSAQPDSSAYRNSNSKTIKDSDVAASEENETAASDTSQNFFNWKKDIHQPFSQHKISSRVRADKEVNTLKKDDDFWYIKSIEKFKSSPDNVTYEKAARDSIAKRKAGADTRRFSEDEQFSFNLPSWVNTLMWAIIIAVFLFAVGYFLLANKINIFSRSGKNSGTALVNSEDVDLFNIPYHELLQKAYAEKNYRLAVRILYLQTLKLLSEKNIIAFQADYTNMDYLQQLSQTMFYKDFFAITRHYEYVWYGGFAVSEPAFNIIQTDFNTIQDKILHR